jgi:glutamate synthase domain-containing protein 3
VQIEARVQNKHRCVGGLLSGEIARRHGADGLPDDTIVINARGHGGQSFGGWLMRGVTLHLDGDANDYTGKGMSGGVLAVCPPEGSTFVPEENVVIGNTVLYGATAGRAFFRGLAGERFAVRNSGVEAVVEGVGDHGCEYMTGGRVVVLGPTGRNFAAGMSGGIAYVLDSDGTFESRCNMELVELEEMGDEDFQKVYELVAEHMERTGSTVARTTLDHWDELRGSWVKVMPMDYKRALRELAEKQAVAAGEPAVVGQRGDGTGEGPIEAGQPAPYMPADGGPGEGKAAREPGEAGQYEDADVAAERRGKAVREADGDPAKAAHAEEEGTEEVLPRHG